MALNIPAPLALGRFKQLAQRSTEVWQGGLFRLPMWVGDPNDDAAEPLRPVGALWVSLTAGLVHVELPAEGAPATPQLALTCLLEFGLKFGKSGMGRPARVEVKDEGLREALSAVLAPLGTVVSVVADLAAAETVLRQFEADSTGGYRTEGLLEQRGVTPADVRAFAVAAAAFYTARPWDHLANDDLVVVESPVPQPLRQFSVLGQGGQEFGLAFFASRAELERLLNPQTVNRRRPMRAHGVTYGPKADLPFADVDAWDDLDLPVAGPAAYPLAGEFDRSGRFARPKRDELVAMTAILGALATTTEDEMDRGRWTRTVETGEGPTDVTLALPYLLEAEAGEPDATRRPIAGVGSERLLRQVSRYLQTQSFDSIDDVNRALGEAVAGGQFDADGTTDRGDASSLDRADDLAFEAREARGRLRIKLARQALAISEDSADAWLVLGSSTSTPDRAIPLIERAVEAARRVIGAERFAELDGHFWGHVETRPYMRARFELAEALWAAGRRDEALGHYAALLALNPNDNQGVRYVLVPRLLEAGQDDEAAAWIARYPDDIGPALAYAHLLLTFKAHGDRPETHAALEAAARVNPHVIDALLAPELQPLVPYDSFIVGSPEEGASAAGDLVTAYEATPGLIEWLEDHGPDAADRAEAAIRRAKKAARAPRAKGTRRKRR